MYLNTRQSETYPQAIEILRAGISFPALYAVPLGDKQDGLHAVYVRAHFNWKYSISKTSLSSIQGAENPLRSMVFTPHCLRNLLKGIEARVQRLQSPEAKSKVEEGLSVKGLSYEILWDRAVEVGSPYQPFDPGRTQRFLAWTLKNHPIVESVKLWHIIRGDDETEFLVHLCFPISQSTLGNGFWKSIKESNLNSVMEQLLEVLTTSHAHKTEEEC